MKRESNRYCVIMCGGAGTRFWPFSRESRPKQFIDFFGTGQSLLQLSIDRIRRLVPDENVLIITNELYSEVIRVQLPWISPSQILLEPSRRDTAPGILWAAHHILARNPDASFVALPADNVILKETSFVEALMRGFEFVENADRMLAIGVTPAASDTSRCYFQKGSRFRECSSIFTIKTIAEKPSAPIADIFFSSREFVWNTGIYIWRADTVIRAFSRYTPDIASIFDVEIESYRDGGELKFIAENFPKATSLPIEYAIIEKADNAYVMETDIGWSDLSSWKALYDLSPKTKEGNVTQNARTLLYDSSGCIVSEQVDKVIAVAGLKDYIVADTPNALMICPIDAEQKIRNIVNDIRDHFGAEYT